MQPTRSHQPHTPRTIHFYHEKAAEILLHFLADLAGNNTEQAKWRAMLLRVGQLGVTDFSTDLLADLMRRQRAFREAENTRLYALPDGGLLLLYHHLQTAKIRPLWQELQACMAAYTAEERGTAIMPEQLAAATTVYDLSISWDAFYEKQKQQYTPKKPTAQQHEKVFSVAEHLAKLRKLATSTLFKSRLLQRSKREAKTILLIEDDPLSIKLIKNALRTHPGLNTEHVNIADATNGLLGLRAYISNPADLVLLDIDMPQLSGQETLQELLAIDPDARVVMLSGNAFKDAIMGAMQTGAKGFLGKPFTPNKLLAYVDKYVMSAEVAQPKEVHVA